MPNNSSAYGSPTLEPSRLDTHDSHHQDDVMRARLIHLTPDGKERRRLRAKPCRQRQPRLGTDRGRIDEDPPRGFALFESWPTHHLLPAGRLNPTGIRDRSTEGRLAAI